ncbi:MAG: TolC family protein [Bacteroidetes bacterium]|nr:TolC family protein [Bacteroidota bacterium]
MSLRFTLFSFSVVLLFPLQIHSQELTIQEYLLWVLKDHPMAQNAELNVQRGDAQFLQAKGVFDPVIVSKWKEKFYQGEDYYNTAENAVVYQSPFALSMVGQLDLNNGDYLNPEMYTGKDGLMTLGFQLPILQGLVIDEKRLAVRRAEQIQAMAILEKQMALNDLLFQSTMMYVEWVIAEKRKVIAQDIANTAEDRYLATKQRFFGGDRPAMDTLEARAQWQSREIFLQEAALQVVKSRLALVAFVEEKNERKNILSLSILPQGNTLDILPLYKPSGMLEFGLANHPELSWYSSKITLLNWEERWKREKLKPKLNIQYNLLSKGMSDGSDVSFSTQNYRWGLEMALPIFLRDARGDLQLQKLKIQEAENDQEWKRSQLNQKAMALEQQERIVRDQFVMYNQNVNLYQRLLEAEQIKFQGGESAVFMVNQRENAWLENQLKALEYERKWMETRIQMSQLLFMPYF